MYATLKTSMIHDGSGAGVSGGHRPRVSVASAARIHRSRGAGPIAAMIGPSDSYTDTRTTVAVMRCVHASTPVRHATRAARIVAISRTANQASPLTDGGRRLRAAACRATTIARAPRLRRSIDITAAPARTRAAWQP